MVDNLIASGFPQEAIVVIISVLPVIELRGALVVAINVFHLPWYEALYLTIIGNLLPVPFLLLFFGSLASVASRTERGRRLVNWVLERTRRRTGVIEKYEHVGLMLFVAIPLPGTGAWTGSVAAFLRGLRPGRAMLSIAAGVIIAGAIVTSLSLLGWVGAVIAGVALVSLAMVGLWKI
jgi:uncharacterized membrane protein